MNRYNVETADRYDMEPAPDGMWVMHDDVQAAIAAAVAAERERCAKLCEKARFTGNTFPRTQMEQLRMDIAAAIRGN